MKLRKMTLNINGVNRMLICDPEKDRLSDVLRRIGLTGVKVGCGTGVCGSCSVILNGKVVRSCTKKITQVEEYSEVTTIEGIGTPQHPHPLQAAWIACGAVQCGFCSPGFIVSAYALLKKNPDPSREEVRDWFQKTRNVCRCTGYKQIVDAVMAAAKVMRGVCTVEQIRYSLPQDKEYYGKPLERPTALAKVCGLADYGDDLELKMPENTLHAVLVQPRVAHHARILNLDVSEAESMPGVVKVVTYKDVKGTNRMALGRRNKRSTLTKANHVLLCEDKIYRYGDVVAMVVADTKDHAREAAKKVRVEIEKLPEYLNYLDAVMPGAMRIHEDCDNLFVRQPVLKGAENVDEIIDASAYQAEGSFYSSREPHLSIEGDTVQAYWDEDGRMTIHCKSQGVESTKGRIYQAIGLEKDQIRVVMNPSGASFGWSTSAGSFALAAVAVMATGLPVALSMTYEEHQHFSGKRSPAYTNCRLGCDENGKITGLEFDSGLDHGAFSEVGDAVIDRLARFMMFPYQVPHVAGLARVANTNHAFGTAYRGFGSPQVYTASEAIMDMLAEKAGIDPFEFRYRNIARPGDLNINSYPYYEYPMEQIMDTMRPYYEQAVKEAKAADTPQVRRGVGLAWGGYNVTEGPSDECSVDLELNPDGTITKYDTWQDLGQGGDIGSLMVTLEALKPLGVTPDQIRLVQSDTKLCPDSGLSASSRSHYMNGNASILAAKHLMNAMKKPDGTWRTYEEMKAEGIPTRYRGTYENTSARKLCYIDANKGIGNPTPAYSYALFLAEAAVDTATGKTTVLRYTCVDDVGTVGNIDALNGQAYGGISHCIGFALSENYDDVVKHRNIAGAGVPYIKDIPDEIRVIHLENPREYGPWGSSGASEAYQSSGHVAVINAIYNATGVRIYELPATPQKVKAGLEILAAGGKIPAPEKYFLGSDFWDEIDAIRDHPV